MVGYARLRNALGAHKPISRLVFHCQTPSMTVNTRHFLPGGIAVCGGVAEQEPEFLEPGVEGVSRGHGGS